jgi:hypothetical protein
MKWKLSVQKLSLKPLSYSVCTIGEGCASSDPDSLSDLSIAFYLHCNDSPVCQSSDQL